MPRKYTPLEVLPRPISKALAGRRDPYWFVIGGHAVRCFCPYRPSDDVDFGVANSKDLRTFVSSLEKRGKAVMLEQTADTLHMQLDGLDISIFILPQIRPYVEDHSLTAEGILATKLHAILDRGARRDFFDLYVIMVEERLGFIDCLRAIRTVYMTDVNEGLLLRAMTFFDDATAEAPLPGEGSRDWLRVQTFFRNAAGALLAPPVGELEIQKRHVLVSEIAVPKKAKKKKSSKRVAIQAGTRRTTRSSHER